jgi:uncharacterized protein DUF6602
MVNEQPVLPRLFAQHQRALRAALELARGAIDHPTSKGDASEAQWRKMLAKHLPQRYRVCKGHVVDSRGGMSDQIDVIIHDAHYCPLFLDEGGTCFVPAESVYAVFEAKQELTAGYVTAAGEKAASVRRLFRTSAPIVDRGEEKQPRPLTYILGGVLALTTGWRDGLGDGFKAAFGKLEGDAQLDLGCVIAAGAFEFVRYHDKEDLVIAPPDAGLVTFFLRLVHRLQAIGTIPAIEWPAYIEAALPPALPASSASATLRTE